MIKAVIFDYGNVISRVDNSRFFEGLSKYSAKTGEELKVIAAKGPDVLKGFETGLISTEAFFKGVTELGDLRMTFSEFTNKFAGRFSPVSETLELIKKLKGMYKLGLLSNTNKLDFESEIKNCGVFSLFDTVTVSFETGVMKPDRRIFFDALNKLGLNPEECIYIDDIEEYVDAAIQIGIQGIQYVSHEGLVNGLNKRGVIF